MARNLFGGSSADAAEDVDGSRVPGAVGTVWTGPDSSATQITDLLDIHGNPLINLTSNEQGMVPHFYGPEGVSLVYADFGAGRVAMTPVNTAGDLAQHLLADDPHGSREAAVSEITAQKGAPNGIATLDPNGRVPASQLPALSGDSSGGTLWLNVKNNPYGALGDGVTDDTAAILAAVDDAEYGDVVYFPPGVYVISQPIDLYKRGVTLKGSHSNLMVGPGMVADEWACYLQAAPTFTAGAMITIIGEDDGDHPAINGEQRIESLMLDGSKVPTGSLDGVYARGNVQNVVLRDVCIRQMPNNGIVTAANTKNEWPYSWRLHSVMVDNCHANGIMMEQNTDLTLEDCQVIGCWSSGYKLSNCANTIITHSRAEWNGNYGFHLFGGWGNWPGSGSATMTGCSTDRNGWDGVRIDASGNGAFLVQGLMTRRDGRNGGTGGGGYAGLRLSNQAPVVINGVTCYVGTDDGGTANTSPDYGVRITGARDVQLTGAYLHGALKGLVDDGTNQRVDLHAVAQVAGINYAEARVSSREHINVRHYGAVGDGVIDDRASIQAALDVAASLPGSTVYFPPGYTYGITEYLNILTGTTVMAHGATIKNIGNRGLAKLYRNTDNAQTGYTGHSDIRICGGVWDQNASDGTTGTATALNNGFMLSHNSNVVFEGVTVQNVSSGHAIDVMGSRNVKILNCRFEGFKDNTGDQSSSFREAIQIDWTIPDSGSNGAMDGTPCKNVLVQGCYFGPSSRLGGFGRAIGSHTSYDASTYADGIQILGNRIEATLQEGIRVYAWKNVVIADNVISGTGSASVIVTGPDPAVAGYAIACQDVVIRGNVIGSAGPSSPVRVIGFATARPSGVSISGNRVTGSTTTGVYVSQATAPLITGNQISACTSSSVYVINCTDPSVSDNQSAGSGGTAIGLDTCTGGHVVANVVNGSAGHGVLVSGGSNVSVTANRVVGAQGSGIRATSNAVRPRIIGNTILRNGVTAVWGLDVTASATDALVLNNDLTGSTWPTGTAYNLVGTRQILDWTGATEVAAPGQNLVS